MEKQLDIVSLIERNPIVQLTTQYQGVFANKLKERFCDTQQQLFVASFYCYLNHNSTKEFIINLDDIWKWLGFSRKDPAKRVLQKHFSQNVDYKIALHNSVERKNDGGYNKEHILLTVETFKTLCMLAATDKSKEIRQYYIKLEELLQEVISQEAVSLRQQLEQKDQELQTTKKQLEARTKQRYLNVKPGHAVYAVKSNVHDKNSLISIGKTRSIAQRESNYLTHNQESQLFYYKTCKNCDLTEKVIHHLLASERVNEREWFKISENTAVFMIDLVCNFLDNFVGSIDILEQSQLLKELQKYEKTKTEDNYQLQNETDKQKNGSEIYDCKEFDYNSFVKDCCLLEPSYFCLPDELLGSYKLWSRRNIDTKKKELFYSYIKNNFDTKKMFIPQYNAVINCYLGIKPKPLVVCIKSSQLKQFLTEKCNVGYIHKVTETQFINQFSSFIGHNLTTDEMIAVKAELNQNFYFGNINHSKEKKKVGYFGFGMKDGDTTIHCLRNKKTRKAVVKLNIETKQVVQEYSSVNAAAFALDKRYETVISYIKNKHVVEECFILAYK